MFTKTVTNDENTTTDEHLFTKTVTNDENTTNDELLFTNTITNDENTTNYEHLFGKTTINDENTNYIDDSPTTDGTTKNKNIKQDDTNGRHEIADHDITDTIYDKNAADKIIPLVTLSEIEIEQHKDPVVLELIKWCKNGEKPKTIQENMLPPELLSYHKQFKFFKFENNIVYRKWIVLENLDTLRWLIVVPFLLQEKIMRQYHDNIAVCHPGIEMSLNACTHKYYWPKMKQDFTMYINGCIKCNQNKQAMKFNRAPLVPLIFYQFGDCISIDHIILNNARPTPRKHTCILTVVDMYTNYCVLYNCKSTGEDEIISNIISYILTHGMFLQIVHDQGLGFCSKLFKKIMQNFNIKDSRTTRYRSVGNGRAESVNKRIGAALRASIPRDDLKNWDLYTKFVQSALNSLKSTRTGFSPNFLVFSRELRYPHEFFIDYEEQQGQNDMAPYDSVAIRANKLYRKMKRVHYLVRKNTAARAGYMKSIFDKKAKGPFFEKGQYCMIFIQPTRTKLSPRWSGPFYIEDKINNNLYVVKIKENEFQITNIEKMKIFKPSKWTTTLAKKDDTPSTTKPTDKHNTSDKPFLELDCDIDESQGGFYIFSREASPNTEAHSTLTPTNNILLEPNTSSQEISAPNTIDRPAMRRQTDPANQPYQAGNNVFTEIEPREPRPQRNPKPIARWGIHKEPNYK